jgi:hypothetical protein
MHPEILRELTSQRGREMQARAHRSMLARMLRASRRGAAARHEGEEIALPAIPDYVDGSFRTGPAGAAAGQPDRAQAARRAA